MRKRLRRFILAEDTNNIQDIIDYSFVSIEANANQEIAYNMIKKCNLTVLPVVDKCNVLFGIVTVDDLIDVNEEEISEDFQKTSAISPMEESYYSFKIQTGPDSNQQPIIDNGCGFNGFADIFYACAICVSFVVTKVTQPIGMQTAERT